MDSIGAGTIATIRSADLKNSSRFKIILFQVLQSRSGRGRHNWFVQYCNIFYGNLERLPERFEERVNSSKLWLKDGSWLMCPIYFYCEVTGLLFGMVAGISLPRISRSISSEKHLLIPELDRILSNRQSLSTYLIFKWADAHPLNIPFRVKINPCFRIYRSLC